MLQAKKEAALREIDVLPKDISAIEALQKSFISSLSAFRSIERSFKMQKYSNLWMVDFGSKNMEDLRGIIKSTEKFLKGTDGITGNKTAVSNKIGSAFLKETSDLKAMADMINTSVRVDELPQKVVGASRGTPGRVGEVYQEELTRNYTQAFKDAGLTNADKIKVNKKLLKKGDAYKTVGKILSGYNSQVNKDVNKIVNDNVNQLYTGDKDPHILARFFRDNLKTKYSGDDLKFAAAVLVHNASFIGGMQLNNERLKLLAQEAAPENTDNFLNLLYGIADMRAMLKGNLNYLKSGYDLFNTLGITTKMSVTDLLDVRAGRDTYYSDWADLMWKKMQEEWKIGKNEELLGMKDSLEIIKQDTASKQQDIDWSRFAGIPGITPEMISRFMGAQEGKDIVTAINETKPDKKDLFARIFISPDITPDIVDIVRPKDWRTVVDLVNRGYDLKDVLFLNNTNTADFNNLRYSGIEKVKKAPIYQRAGSRIKSFFTRKPAYEKPLLDQKKSQLNAIAHYLVTKWDWKSAAITDQEIKDEAGRLSMKMDKNDIKDLIASVKEQIKKRDTAQLDNIASGWGVSSDEFTGKAKQTGFMKFDVDEKNIVPVVFIPEKSLNKDDVKIAIEVFLASDSKNFFVKDRTNKEIYKVKTLEDFVNKMFSKIDHSIVDSALSEILSESVGKDRKFLQGHLEADKGNITSQDLLQSDTKLFVDWAKRGDKGVYERVRLMNIGAIEKSLGGYVDVSTKEAFDAVIKKGLEYFASKKSASGDTSNNYLKLYGFSQKLYEETKKQRPNIDKLTGYYEELSKATDLLDKKAKLEEELGKLKEDDKAGKDAKTKEIDSIKVSLKNIAAAAALKDKVTEDQIMDKAFVQGKLQEVKAIFQNNESPGHILGSIDVLGNIAKEIKSLAEDNKTLEDKKKQAKEQPEEKIETAVDQLTKSIEKKQGEILKSIKSYEDKYGVNLGITELNDSAIKKIMDLYTEHYLNQGDLRDIADAELNRILKEKIAALGEEISAPMAGDEEQETALARAA